ncbi:MAG TPA: MotA/TolQ/ExbB proton channel family protein [Burkholderiales bacterium]|nr:MotA/TolQ/ExbB proton channel family protein [Burkholderiales bacterium]
MRIFKLTAALLLLVPGLAQAWWNSDWAHREKITVNVPADVKQPLAQLAVPVRLHSGNFMFVDAGESGNDLRFIADDDKTPLKFHIERFDSVNELAIVWVQLPRLTPGPPGSFWLYYGNPKAPAGDDAKGTYDPNQTFVLHFDQKEGLPKDATAYANNPAQSTATLSSSGLMDGGATFNGQAKINLPATPSLQVKSSGGFTFSAWVKPAEAQKDAVLFAQTDGARSITIGITDGNAVAQLANGQTTMTASGAPLAAGAWHHVAVTIKDSLTIYVDGKQASTVPAALLADIGGDIVIGGSNTRDAGFKGDLDEVEVANVVRSADWVAAAFASQSADGKLLMTAGEAEDNGGGGVSYFGIILNSVTVDGWVVIGILMVMLVIAFWVMIDKALFINRVEAANGEFRDEFNQVSDDLTSLDRGDWEEDGGRGKGGILGALPLPKFRSVGAMSVRLPGINNDEDDDVRFSPLYRLYYLGIRELKQRFDKQAAHERGLSGPALNAIKASVDAGLVREMQRLNNRMVLLTIAISGGPFLGLLGTVVGVMITFAAIAAIGDVNVNAIAPGIAAALVATVAGLSVAIPSLFGYNYLASRIKNISSDMQVFVDEFITRLAESYAPDAAAGSPAAPGGHG